MGNQDSKKEVNLLEEGQDIQLDFTKLNSVAKVDQDVIPTVVQDVKTGRVLIVAYVNKTALDYTLEHRVAAFWSTSRNELWVKGLTSGDVLDIHDVLVNCEQNSLLYLVSLRGQGSCHTKDQNDKPRYGCYYRRIQDDKLEFTD